MGRGRPRKSSALRELEGNRSRTAIPPDMNLHGTPETPKGLTAEAAKHYRFLAAEFGGCGALKRADGPALWMLADLFGKYVALSRRYEKDHDDRDALSDMLKVKARWDSAASKLGIQVIDRAKIMSMTPAALVDPIEEEFLSLKVTG